MIKKLLVLLLLVGIGISFFPLSEVLSTRDSVSPLAESYLANGAEDLGSANLVTSVVVTYRGLDTLGEVTVLFAASAAIALIFKRKKDADGDKVEKESSHQGPSEIVVTGAKFLFPLILVFGVYIFVHGHLSPGGGFQGGVVIASGVLLLILAGQIKELNHSLVTIVEALSGAAYVGLGLLGLWLAAGFLDPRFLPQGEVGQLFSAGAIPIIYSLLGIKVGAELSGVIDSLRSKA
jgi:multicomponent Na+:H+ antiporter subunit B